MKGNKVYVILSVDTECDKDVKWEIPQPMSFNNIERIVSKLMPVCNRYGVKPTFLLSPEVLQNDYSLNILKEINNCSLGAHLHEEFIAPNKNLRSKTSLNIQAELDVTLEFEKLKNLTNLFESKIGYSPLCFRSGRFGSSKNTIRILNDLGYLVDSSITPFKTHYFKNDLKINHWGKSIVPYFESLKEDGGILQVPLTLYNNDFFRLPVFLLKMLESKQTLLKKILNKLGFRSRTVWLRPYRQSEKKLINIADQVIETVFKNENFTVLNIMFHSNELLEGASPYCKTEKEVDEFVNSLESLFISIKEKYELCSIGLEETYWLYGQK